MTNQEKDFLLKLRHRYNLYTGDNWRCDFCESNCDCDEIYLEGLIDDFRQKFPVFDREKVEDFIKDIC